MYHFHLVPLFAAIINLLAAVIVIASNRQRVINRVIFLLGLCIVTWNLGTYILSQTRDPASAISVFRMCTLAIGFIPAIICHASSALNGSSKGGYRVVAPYIVSLAVYIATYSKYGVVSGRTFGNIYRNTGGPAFWVFYLWVAVGAVASLPNFARLSRGAEVPYARLAKFLKIAVLILVTGILHDSIHVLGLNHYPGTKIGTIPYGTLAAAIYGLLLGYYLLSEQLLELRISIGRRAATLLRLFFLIGVAYLLLLSVGGLFPGLFTKQSLSASLAILFISTLTTVHFFPKILGEYTDWLGATIIGDRFEYHDKIRAFIREYRPSNETFRDYLERCAELVFTQLNVSAVGITITSAEPNALGGATKSIAGKDWSLVFGEKSPLRTHFKSARQAHIDLHERSNSKPEEHAARSLMNEQSLVLAFPIGADEKKKNAGLLVVGPRRDGRSLNQLDAEVLSSLCLHIATRIERMAVERNDELQKANEAKDRFLANVNHEIRNPLNGIHGVVQMLKDHCTEPRAKFLLGTLQSCTDQLRTTLDDVLDFNQIGAEVAAHHPSRVALVELVRSTTRSHDVSGGDLEFKGVTGDLNQTGSANPELLVWCDAGKFSHILTNYLINALKYGVPPGACVQLHAEAKGDTAVRVKLTVTSTGPTLSPDEVLSLFTPLTRGRRAHETKAHGLGLGLALSKKLAEAMGGNVGVESAHGKTTFWFVAEFPLVNADDPQAPQPVLDVAGRFALAIEDEPYNRLVLGYHLNRFGILPVWAEDGASALAAAQNRSFDLIILDWLLPDMEGEELLSKLRASSPKPLPPVVVVSAYSSANKHAASFAVGAAAFVNKPIDEAKLAEALGACKLGPPVTVFDNENGTTDSVDLSPLKAASNDPAVVESFLREIEASHSKLLGSWKTDSHAAASLAHRLRGQMLLVRAKESAGLLEVMERALKEGAASADIERLAEALQREFSAVVRSIRALIDPAPGTGSK